MSRVLAWALMTVGAGCFLTVAADGLRDAIEREGDVEEVQDKIQEYREERELHCMTCGEVMQKKLDVEDLMLHWCLWCGSCRLVAPDLEDHQEWWVPLSAIHSP